MTVQEAINRIDDLRPNPYTPQQKAAWLANLDGLIMRDVILKHEGAPAEPASGYTEDPLYRELLVKAPDDELYVLWLEAKIDYANKDIEAYNNSAQAFADAYRGFSDHYIQTHKPKGAQFNFF